MYKTKRYLFYLWIILMPFQDTILGLTPLHMLGLSISSLPLIAHVMVSIVEWMFTQKQAIRLTYLIIIIWSIILSIYYLEIWGLYSHGMNVAGKSINMLIVTILWAYAILAFDYTPTSGMRNAVYVAFAITIFGYLACDVQVPGLGFFNSTIFHAMGEGSLGRSRSFTTESSNFSALIASLGVAAAHLSQHRLVRNLFIASTPILLILSTSKGAVAVLLIALVWFSLLRRPSIWKVVLFAVSFAPAVFLALLVLSAQFSSIEAVQDAVTYATRLTLWIWTFVVIFHNPFGVGFTGMYEAFTIYLPRSMDYASHLVSYPLNFSEVETYLYPTRVLDAKSFLGEYLVMFGFPFLIVAIIFVRRVIRALYASGNSILLLGFMFMVLAMSTYLNDFVLYNTFFILGLGYSKYKEQHVIPASQLVQI